ncbi:hypothetical protein [Treponema endosymbiont of Eucomonympha sp.]|uniref:hypothetical protein n=1 Tax=Treponema endosymbiont of Eucomonympha sp. TaxID=1580831 RepID=UPI000780E805|nr:hypothetical protein [Treponema endosymbiont of Eucomonympha sp.]
MNPPRLQHRTRQRGKDAAPSAARAFGTSAYGASALGETEGECAAHGAEHAEALYGDCLVENK